MDLLIIGGTRFLGPHVVEAALARGDRVTLFNRGGSGATPAGVEWIKGDRDGGLGALAGGRWDAAIDTCGMVPRIVRASVEAIGPDVGRYVFISTISVYPEDFGGSLTEDEPVIALADPSVEEVTPQTYGGLKALCETEVTSRLGDRALIVRPGLIVGPLDPTDRFTYWPNRFALGGEVLAPGTPDAYVSFIDVRDLARFLLDAVGAGASGVYNASGTYGVMTMSDVLGACSRAADGGAPVWVSEAFLLANDVTPWTEMPLWVPQGEDVIIRASSARAVAAGLAYRPLDDTVRATLAWTRGLGIDRALRAGPTREREEALLRKWKLTEAEATSQR
ncbi:MAG: NAD-dependent epimerase/dehydratase family protein [Candidatus Eremiobacteraeota bacterium]|nr:NAD-dependent epimerase/dehydratase family protein [Candidatus Eremiobacteraeota bacterium]